MHTSDRHIISPVFAVTEPTALPTAISAYDELGYAGGLGDPRCRIDEKVAALDNAYKADGEQHDNKCERAFRKVNSHFDNSLIIFLAHKK